MRKHFLAERSSGDNTWTVQHKVTIAVHIFPKLPEERQGKVDVVTAAWESTALGRVVLRCQHEFEGNPTMRVI